MYSLLQKVNFNTLPMRRQLFSRTVACLCSSQSGFGVSWSNSVSTLSRQVYGRWRRVQLNIEQQKELTEAQDRINPAMLDVAEAQIKRLYWGEFGDAGAVTAADNGSKPQIMMAMSRILVFAVKNDPELSGSYNGEKLEKYALHTSAVCQSLYIATIQQAQRVLDHQLLDMLSIEVLTKVKEANCHLPRLLPTDAEAIEALFQHFSDVASEAAGINKDDEK